MTTSIENHQTRSIAQGNIDDLVNAVGEDPELLPIEKETIFRLGKGDDKISVFTEEGSLTRRLLRHPLCEVQALRIYTDDHPSVKMSVADYSEGLITGVWGELPVGALKVQSQSRSDQAHCKIVSKDAWRNP